MLPTSMAACMVARRPSAASLHVKLCTCGTVDSTGCRRCQSRGGYGHVIIPYVHILTVPATAAAGVTSQTTLALEARLHH